jgi:hypothetical protein
VSSIIVETIVDVELEGVFGEDIIGSVEASALTNLVVRDGFGFEQNIVSMAWEYKFCGGY